MELVISKSELSKALFFTQSVVGKKTSMPILVNVLLTATADGLRLAGTDLELAAVSSVKANVKSPGTTTVNARIFADLVRELPETDLHLRLTEGERLEIKAGRSTLRIIGFSAQEYPNLPGIGLKTETKVAADQLLEMINQTIYAVSNDETRFNLNGVCFEPVETSKSGKKDKAGPSLRLVATDGHRLALITRPVGEFTFSERVIVPKKGLSEMRRILEAAGTESVGIALNEGFLVIEQGDTKLSIRLIDGEFPDYSMVIPKTKGNIVKVNNKDFQQALRRVLLLVSDKEKSVRMDINEEELRISSSSPDLGDAHESLSVTFDGKPLSIGFNAGYLLDAVSSLDIEHDVLIELNGDLGPGQFRSDGDESYLGIVMPMRLQQPLSGEPRE